MKRFLIVLALAALMILLGTSALAAMPSACPDCGKGYKESWDNRADSRACRMWCDVSKGGCGYEFQSTHTEETCSNCGYAKYCDYKVTQLEGNKHLMVCQNAVCLRGYGGEGQVKDCGKNNSCYANYTCYQCNRVIPPDPNNHNIQAIEDEAGHYYKCRNYGLSSSATGITCEYRTKIIPHTYADGVCTECDYFNPSLGKHFVLRGFEIGADADDIELLNNYDCGDYLDTAPYRYYLVKADGSNPVYDSNNRNRYTGKIEPDTEYWLYVLLESPGGLKREINNDGLHLNVPFTDSKFLTYWYGPLCFRLAPLTAKIVPETGDGMDIMLWTGMAAVSFAGMMMFGRKKKKEY